jgi:small subunit ribosomal protein S16
MVRLRLARSGRPHRPFYRIGAVDSRVKRDGAVIENLGWYNPMAKTGEKATELHVDRIKYWLSVGAQPSDTLKAMLAKIGLASQEELAEALKITVESRKKREANIANGGAKKKDDKKK